MKPKKPVNHKTNISEVKYYPRSNDQGRFGFVSFVVNGCIKVQNVSVYARIDSPTFRLLYPQSMLFNGSVDYLVLPIKKSVGEHIEKVVTSEINEILKKKDADNFGNFKMPEENFNK